MTIRVKRRVRLVAASAAVGAALIACNARRVQKPYCEIAGEQKQSFEQNISNKLDLLVLVDNSNSMAPKQSNVFCNFPRFINVLKGLPAGLPDLHLAVISSDMGAGSTGAVTCTRPGGDDGRFQSQARPGQVDCSQFGGGQAVDTTGCTGPTDGKGYIRYKSQNDNNVGGQDLSAAFTCIANLGTGGCGFEGQIASIKRALERAKSTDPNDPNSGFLRPEAFLAVLILSDEDDCSVPPDSLLFDTSQGTDVASPLGPLTSFRCTEYGVLCDNNKPPRMATPADLQNCVSNENGQGTDPQHALMSVGGLAADIQMLKPPGQTIVEAISGPAPPDGRFAVEIKTIGGQMVPDLAPSCNAGGMFGEGDPAVRIQQFLRAWDPNKKVVTICQESFSEALATIAMKIGQKLGDQCIANPPLNQDGLVTDDPNAADCSVADVQDPGLRSECRIPLARCGSGTTTQAPSCLQNAPEGYANTCWYLEKNPTGQDGQRTCTATNLALRVCRSGWNGMGCAPGMVEAPPNTSLSVKCASCTQSNIDPMTGRGVECRGDGLDNDCNGAIDDQGEPCDCS